MNKYIGIDGCKRILLIYNLQPNMTNELTNDTPIHIATKHNDLIIVAILLKFKSDPKIRNILNKTPIDIATKMDDTKIIDLMNNENVFGMSVCNIYIQCYCDIYSWIYRYKVHLFGYTI